MRPILTVNLSARTLMLVLTEHLLVVLSVAIGAFLRMGGPASNAEILNWNLIWRASLIAAVLQVCLHYSDLYDLRKLADRRGVVIGLIQALGAASFILAFLYFWIPALIIGRGVFAVASVIIVGSMAGWRIAFDWMSLRMSPAERLLIVGTGTAAVALADELFKRRQELGVELVGFVDPDPARVGTTLINPGIIGTVSDIPRIAREHGVDRVVVSLADARGKLSMDELLRMKLNEGVRFDHLASLYEEYTGKIAVENLRPSWLIFSEGFRRRRTLELSKRALDVTVSLTGLILASPILLLVALLQRLTSPGPVLYHQERVGKDGQVFTIVKFRSMRTDAEDGTGAVWSRAGDPRVTGFGRILRRTRLDELPQLWNVLRGDMSLVGPRPERPEFVKALTEQIPYYGQRHAVRPGVSGWAQVRHDYASSVADSLEKLQYDLFYIKNVSIPFDLFIALETIKTVLVRRGS
jgi:sugar transferase (PEP-CTERM system associated)